MSTRSRPPSAKAPQDITQVRLVLHEQAAPDLPFDEPKNGSVPKVTIELLAESALDSFERLERSLVELDQAGRQVREVTFVLSEDSGYDMVWLRRAALRAVVRKWPGSESTIWLVLPSPCTADLRAEAFGLADLIETSPNVNIKIRFAEDLAATKSGVFPSLATKEQKNGNAAQESGSSAADPQKRRG